jgi:hypothetical protein
VLFARWIRCPDLSLPLHSTVCECPCSLAFFCCADLSVCARQRVNALRSLVFFHCADFSWELCVRQKVSAPLSLTFFCRPNFVFSTVCKCSSLAFLRCPDSPFPLRLTVRECPSIADFLIAAPTYFNLGARQPVGAPRSPIFFPRADSSFLLRSTESGCHSLASFLSLS